MGDPIAAKHGRHSIIVFDDGRPYLLRGHDLQFSAAMGSLQTVMFKDGVFYGYSDPRRPGALSRGYE